MDTPSAWLLRRFALIRRGGRVLDVACGHGRHARPLAEMGWRVTAVDRDAEALRALHGISRIETTCADLESGDWPFSGESFDGIVVSRYLHRPLFGAIRASLADDGVLLYETFAVGQEALGRPKNPDFLLRPGELLQAFATLTVVTFEQGKTRDAVVQRMCAVGPGYAWPPALDQGPDG